MSANEAVLGQTGIASLALYVHIPFCETKCPYCDFNTYAKIESLIPTYVAALSKEINLWGDLLGNPPVKTVFFGGGTPSYLPEEHVGSVMQTIRGSFQLEAGAEVTLEANPGDFTPSKLAAYLAFGVNRLSIGVQSLDDRLLKALGRRHTAAEALDAYRLAFESGFGNISIDLMYGLPHQSIEDWQQTLSIATDLEPQHISMYCLTLEEGTPLHEWVKSGRIPEPDPDLAADMYLNAQNTMGRRGYRNYEISNWARPGLESRHNLAYWLNQPYLGVGPGAHSYLGENRFSNLKSPKEYVSRLQGVGAPAQRPGDLSRDALMTVPVVGTIETVAGRLEIAETLMMGLRLDNGVSIEQFADRFGVTPEEAHGESIAELTSLGLMETPEGHLRLTNRGWLLANEVFVRFFE